MIYVIAPSIWVLIDLPLRADFSPTHPSDCFAIDLPNVPVARARAFRSPTVVLGEWPRLPFTARIERAQLHRARSASKKDGLAADSRASDRLRRSADGVNSPRGNSGTKRRRGGMVGRPDYSPCSRNARLRTPLARAKGTSRRASGWAGGKIARSQGVNQAAIEGSVEDPTSLCP